MGYIEKETISRARRPEQPKPITTKNECNHTYKELDSEIKRVYGDNKIYITIVDAVLYCEKCLNVEKVNEVFEEPNNDDV